jgi:hypothetical protein
MTKIISFIYQIDDDVYWNDGLRAALDYFNYYKTGAKYCINRHNIGKHGMSEDRFNVDKMTVGDIQLVWGGFMSTQVEWAVQSKKPKALLFAGGPINHSYAHKFDVIFVEDDWTLQEFRKIGINAKLAFGTNTQLFKPMQLAHHWDYIYPAAFALWKRHDTFMKYVNGKKALAVGYMQPNDVEKECYEICQENGVDVLPRVTPDVLVRLINMSKEVVVTADIMGGGQRTILEALACKKFINKELLNSRLLSVYNRGLLTEVDYYEAIRDGLEPLWNQM